MSGGAYLALVSF